MRGPSINKPTIRDLIKRIEELERRVKELENREVTHPVNPVTPVNPYPYPSQPWGPADPYPTNPWPNTHPDYPFPWGKDVIYCAGPDTPPAKSTLSK